jgi:hypothetical protein
VTASPSPSSAPTTSFGWSRCPRGARASSFATTARGCGSARLASALALVVVLGVLAVTRPRRAGTPAPGGSTP